MHHFRLPCGYAASILALAVTVASTAGGCRSALTTVAYLIKGTNVDAEYAGLKGKRVAVVCRPLASLTYRDSHVAKQLAEQVSSLLQANVPKIDMIDQEEVLQWLDEHSDWAEYAEIGEALQADLVVGIDLHSFSIYQSQVLYQGRATVAVGVYDCSQDGKVVFEKELPQSVYPPNALIPTHERPESEFRREYLRILADQIGRHFYAHDAHADYALDAAALQ